ncbi:hypothetical protein [Namhaeicola litoreus]|uniref:Uncharacterized protein n=1 Tax=Namhaeicola litoreus TaxID=1052145 RepID=A0ABW3Y1K2_9FLAO
MRYLKLFYFYAMRWILLFFLSSSGLVSQNVIATLESTQSLDADTFIGRDALANIYYVKNNIFFKKSEKFTLNYQNPDLGTLSSVDITNPFKIILFYKDFNTVIILDNNLNPHIAAIGLQGVNYSLVSFASENNLWLYSTENNMLELYDYQLNRTRIVSQPLYFYQKNFLAKEMISTNQYVYLLGTTGVLAFNQYGSFMEFKMHIDFSDLTIWGKERVMMKNNRLFLANDDEIPILIKEPVEIKDFYFSSNSLQIFDGKQLWQFKIE